jgi:hypothetical protein
MRIKTDEVPRMARTTRAGGVYRPGYESILPREARDELLQRKRPVVKPPAPPRKAHGWVGFLGYGALIGLPIAGLILLASLSTKSLVSVGLQTPSSASTPTTAPVATPAPQSTPASAPRARLIRLPSPPPRAQLVRLPESQDSFTDRSPAHIDETHTIQMPYGTVVNATLRGFLEQENQLPRVGQVGDMYVVGDTPWIWTTPPGAVSPQWTDP